jgi:hypothetical protein
MHHGPKRLYFGISAAPCPPTIKCHRHDVADRQGGAIPAPRPARPESAHHVVGRDHAAQFGHRALVAHGIDYVGRFGQIEREVDFGVVVEPKSGFDLVSEPVMTDPFCLVCRADHPFAAKKSVRWNSLSDQNLVLLDHASGSRQLIDQALATHAVRSNVAQELGHSTTVFQMIAAGIGIGILPMLAMPAPEASGLVVRALTPRVDRTIMLARRKNRSLSPLAETVWKLIAEIARIRKL